jgi:hypothetical protein
MKNKEKLIFYTVCFNLIFKTVILKRHLFLSYPVYRFGYVNPILSNEIPVQTKCTVQTMFVHNYMNSPHTGFPKIWLTL